MQKLTAFLHEPGRVEFVRHGVVHGWATRLKGDAPSLVEILVDGAVVGTAVADLPRRGSVRSGFRDQNGAFQFDLTKHTSSGAAHVVSARVQGGPDLVGKRTLRSSLEGRLESYQNLEIVGWLWDSSRPNTPIDVDIVIGGQRHTVSANVERRDLRRHKKGNGRHGFAAKLPVALEAGVSHELRAFAAGTEVELSGSPLQIDMRTGAPEGVLVGVTPDGCVTGWAALLDQPNVPAALEVLVDGAVVGRALADGFHSDLVRLNDRRGFCVFEYRLPEQFLTGITHIIDVRFAGTEWPLDASPQQFAAADAVLRPEPPADAEVSNLTSAELTSASDGDAVLDPSAYRPPLEPLPPPGPFRRVSRNLLWLNRRLPIFFEYVERAALDASKTGGEIRGIVEADERFAGEFLAGYFDDARDMPLVSIIMPTWNRAYVIAEAIQSVIEQSYPNWELLVCDDGSTDNTRAVVAAFQNPRIQHLQLAKANGAVARNFGLRASSGEIIAYLDSDNIWHPDFLACAVRALDGTHACRTAFFAYFDAEIAGTHVESCIPKLQEFNYVDLLHKNHIDLNSFVHRRELYEELSGFDEGLIRLQDWDLALRYLAAERPLRIPLHFVFYRRNKAWDQITHAHGHRKHIREEIQKATIDRLAQSPNTRVNAAAKTDAVVRILITDGRVSTALEAASLAHHFGSISRVYVHAANPSLDLQIISGLLSPSVTLSSLAETSSADTDLLLPVGEGERPQLKGRWILPASESATSASEFFALRSPVVEPQLNQLERKVAEIPWNLPPCTRSEQSVEALNGRKLKGSNGLLTLIRVSSDIFDDATVDPAARKHCGRVLFVDCEQLRLRDPSGETRDLELQEVHDLQKVADVWVDWDPRSAWLDGFFAQAMLEDCIAVSASAPKDDFTVRCGAVLSVPIRDWRRLSAAISGAVSESELGVHQKLRAKCFAMTSFSDVAVRRKLMTFLAHLEKAPATAAVSAPARKFVAPRHGSRPESNGWSGAMLRLLSNSTGSAGVARKKAGNVSAGPVLGNDGQLARRYRKLMRDPAAFFSDSRNPIVRAIGDFILDR